jgi:hypothetical protein
MPQSANCTFVSTDNRSPEQGLWAKVASEEKNLMLNPSHPRFQEVRALSKRQVVLDKRLYSAPAKRRSSAQRKRKQ